MCGGDFSLLTKVSKLDTYENKPQFNNIKNS